MFNTSNVQRFHFYNFTRATKRGRGVMPVKISDPTTKSKHRSWRAAMGSTTSITSRVHKINSKWLMSPAFLRFFPRHMSQRIIFLKYGIGASTCIALYFSSTSMGSCSGRSGAISSLYFEHHLSHTLWTATILTAAIFLQLWHAGTWVGETNNKLQK